METQIYSESSQLNITNQDYTAIGQQKIFKIPAGCYDIDQCNVQVRFDYAADARNICIRKEFPLFFQGFCQVKIDGKIVATYQNLLSAQQMQYYTYQYQPSEHYEQSYQADWGYIPNRQFNSISPITGASVGTLFCYSWNIKQFLPFIFPSKEGPENRFFKVNQQMEVLLTLTNVVGTLVQCTIQTREQTAVDVTINNGAAKLGVQFFMQKYMNDDQIPARLNRVIEQDEAALQTLIQMGVPDMSDVSNFQCLMFQAQSPNAITCGQIAATFADNVNNITSMKIIRNGCNLIQATDYNNARAQTNSYQIFDTGVLMIPQWTVGQRFEYKLQCTGALEPLVSFLLVYHDQREDQQEQQQ